MRFKNYTKKTPLTIDHIINELVNFQSGKDKDYPASMESGVLVFNKNETYVIKGLTNDLTSHAIRHLPEFDETFFNEIVYLIKKQLMSSTPVYLLKDGKIGQVIAISNSQIVNTMDLVHDKVCYHERLYPPEEMISKYLQQITERYNEIIEGMIKDYLLVDINTTPKEIIKAFQENKTVKFLCRDRDADLIHYYNPERNAVVIEYKNQIRSAFVLKRPGWYTVNNKKVYNQFLYDILKKR